jgi:hypothetical protein
MALTLSTGGQGGVFTLRGGSFGGRFQTSVTPPGLLLDVYPNASIAYSLRKLRTAYTGNAIRVRRSSDNTETDIGFVSNQLDTAAISTFCGAGNGFVTTWYDQSGNNNNASQATASFQPQIYFSGSFVYRSGKVYLQFPPTAELNAMTQITRTAVQNYSFWSTYEKNATGNQSIYFGFGGYLWLDYGANQYISNLSPINITPNNYAINTRYLVNHISDTSTVTIYSNNSIWGSRTNIDQASIRTICSTSSRTATITMAEFVFYSDSRAANRTAINTNINSFYSIY